MKKTLLIIGLIMSYATSYAQSDIQVWQLSSLEFSGTSRYNAMAGAFGALGGDVSMLSQNPGGIGLFRRSEFTFTPGFQLNSTNDTYLGKTSDDIVANFNLNNIGYVSSTKLEEDNWRNVQFGISYNRVKDFYSNQTIIGTTNGTTYADQLAGMISGVSAENLVDPESASIIDSYLAWQNYVIDPGEIENTYVSAFAEDSVRQVYNNESKGRIGETTIAFGGNYNDRVYLGAAIGFQRIKMSEDISLKETAQYEVGASGLATYRIGKEIEREGVGINFKIGGIFRVNNNIRAGIAYHSPSFMSLETNETVTMSAVSGSTERSETSPQFRSEYNISTPTKIIGSLAVIIGKQAVIDVDYEYADFRKMRIKSGGDSEVDFSAVNQTISSVYQATNNVRVGGEWRLKPFSLRAGMAYYQNPNKDGSSLYASERLIYTGGVGYKRENTYIDMALRIRSTEEQTYFYHPLYAESVDHKYKGTSLSITWGTRF